MTGIRTRRAVARRRKAAALVAAGAVVLAGATVTSLATWVDEEWVTAGVDGVAGVAASEFEIEQLVSTDGSTWQNRETGPGGVIDFDDVAQRLSPGSVAYGWVSLRAATGSLGGTVTLEATYVDGTSALGDVLRYGATLHASAATCTAGGYAGGTSLVADGSPLDTGSGATTFDLPAGSGAPGASSTVCFRIEFPSASADDALQGVGAAPGWYVSSASD